MQSNLSYKKQTSDLPELCAMMSSLIRLMSGYVKEPSLNQGMALLHMMNQVENHPDMSGNIIAETAIKQARVIWREELEQAKVHCQGYCQIDEKNKGNVH